MLEEPGEEAPAEVESHGHRTSVRLVTYGLVTILAVLVVVSMAAIAAIRLAASTSVNELRTHWVPAQTSAVALAAAYVDESTAQRGYLLAGEPRFLTSFERGWRSAGQLEAKLRSLLMRDPTALERLSQVTTAHARWQALAEDQITARRAGPLPLTELAAMAVAGKQRFDTLRTQLASLTARTDALATDDLNRIAALNLDANLATLAAVALAVAVALLAIPALRRVLARPLERLIGRVQRVAGGEYEESIPADGPAELASIAEAVDRMRRSILRSSADLMAARHALTLQTERERIAADLHDLTIQRVFALGLALSATASGGGEAAVALRPLIDETDRIIRELRGIIFDVSDHPTGSLRAGVSELVRDSARALGFAPDVELRGPVDHAGGSLAEELLAVLHEALSNVARHAGATRADVTVSMDPDALTLTVADDGRGLPATRPPGRGIRNMEARATRLGGQLSIAGGPAGGTTVEWRVPLPGTPSVEPDGAAEQAV